MIKKFIIQSIAGFILWTALLTPYMVFIVKVDVSQYMKWGLMQLIIVPPVSVVVVNATNWIVKKIIKEDK